MTEEETPEIEPECVSFQIQPKPLVWADLPTLFLAGCANVADAVSASLSNAAMVTGMHAMWRKQQRVESKFADDVERFVASKA